MKYKIKNTSDFEKELDLKVDNKDLEEYKDEAIKRISKNLKIKGFRPGKIPPNIVTREVGEDAINEEAIELFLPEKLFSILKDEEINPATRPVIKKIEKKEKNFEIDVLITLWPKLSKLPKLEQAVEVESIKPTEEELDDQIDRVRTQFAEVSKVERPVQSGDYALVNISAKKNNNDLKDFNFQDYLYEVGSNTLTAQLDSKLEAVSPGAIVKFNENLPKMGARASPSPPRKAKIASRRPPGRSWAAVGRRMTAPGALLGGAWAGLAALALSALQTKITDPDSR